MAVRQEFQIFVIEMEVLKRVKNATGAGHHAITAAFRQMASEYLEHTFTVGGAVFQRGVKHRVFVHVGHQSRRIIHH